MFDFLVPRKVLGRTVSKSGDSPTSKSRSTIGPLTVPPSPPHPDLDVLRTKRSQKKSKGRDLKEKPL